MTVYGVIADVHGNVEALRAIVEALRRRGVERWIVAGDIVGYGAYPNECIETLADLGALCVAGNHELMVLGRLSDERTIQSARVSLKWTADRLTESSTRFLAGLPVRAEVDDIVVTHGSLDSVTEYVTRPRQAATQLDRIRAEHPDARVLVLGHTHHPWAWSTPGGGMRSSRLSRTLPKNRPLLLNPGAVGQSRGLLVRAQGALLDLDAGRIEFVAVRYDVATYRAALRSAGLSLEGYQYVPSKTRAALRGVRRAVAGY